MEEHPVEVEVEVEVVFIRHAESLENVKVKNFCRAVEDVKVGV